MRVPSFLHLESLTSGQRKLVYLGGIVVLMVGAIILGAPATGEDGGGKLPQMRVEYDLGESTLGEVDPSSATMNLVLLGLRGVAANVLWMEHEELKKTKNWARMESTVNSIITLQPHFLQVWRYHGWDLAFNVSSQWDDLRDRFFWVKKGAKFTKRGVDKNNKYAELPWDVGRMVGHKMGRSDEWRYFRKFFVKDPNPEFEGRPDPELNPEGEDNYLVAKQWYQKANEKEAVRQEETGKGQKQMMRELFRHYPARSYFDWADALQREGTFGETSGKAWRLASEEWDDVYGKDRFVEDYNGGGIYWLNGVQDVPLMLKQDQAAGFTVTAQQKKELIHRRQNVTNYRYWKSRGGLEKDNKMVEAHRNLYLGRKLWRSGDTEWNSDGTPPESVQKLKAGLKQFEELFAEFENTSTKSAEDIAKITTDYNLIEEAMLGVYYYLEAHKLHSYPLPKNFPMKKVWDENQARLPEIKMEFDRDLGGQLNN